MRRAGCAAVLVLAVLVAGVAAVVVALSRSHPAPPAAERCVAELDGTKWSLAPDQAQNAALIAAVAIQRGLPARAVTIALATALQESRLVNIDYGDRDSIGLFQQRPSQGWGTVEQVQDPVYATGRFYDDLVKVDGYEDLPITEAAQAVQRSGFPEAYAQHETRARAWASALTGCSPGVLTLPRCTTPTPGARPPTRSSRGCSATSAPSRRRSRRCPRTAPRRYARHRRPRRRRRPERGLGRRAVGRSAAQPLQLGTVPSTSPTRAGTARPTGAATATLPAGRVRLAPSD